MFKGYQTIEEEKVENIEKIIPYENSSSISNYNINNEVSSIINQNILINSQTNRESNLTKNLSANSLENRKEKISSLNSSKNLKKIINNNYKTINVIKKENKIEKKLNKIPNLITLNKDELYNAFVLFQELISREENEKLNDYNFIKNKLFEFVSLRKNNNFSETIECNDNFTEIENENIFDIQNYMPIYYKSERENTNNVNNINLIKSYSFSYSLNNKNKLINNYFNYPYYAKDTIKSNSLIFNEYILINNKIRDKTLSYESKSFHHNYSFDIKNKDKNEFSFNSIHDKEKNKDKYSEKENNDIITYSNNINYENFKSCQKELNHKSFFENSGYYERVLKNNLRKYSTEENLKSLKQKNKKFKKIIYSDGKENKYKYLSKNSSFKENLIISPMKQNINLNKYNNSDNKKYKYIDTQQLKNIKLEIKVNKKKNLNSKEQLIEEKIKELNNEIQKFKEERNKVTLLKEEYEKLHSELLKDIKEFNIKKEIQKKNFKGDCDKIKGIPHNETKFIMNISQHNQSLKLNNNKKNETIELLKQRIYKLENIIKVKNNYEQSKNYIKINNNKKKKNNERSKINLKKNFEYNSSEKIKGIRNNIENINHTINENILNKNYFDNNINKNIIKSKNKKLMNVSYNNQTIKNSLFNSKVLKYNNNINNNFYKKYCNNANKNNNLNKKNYSNNNKIIGINITNNSINSQVFDYQKIDNRIYHTNLNIYEKLINKKREKEKQKNFKRMNLNYLNSERDIFNQKKIIKELKLEILEKIKIDKEKEKDKDKKLDNINIFEKKNILRKYEKSHGKSNIMNKIDFKNDISKFRNNRNILSSYKKKNKNFSNNKKNISVIRPLTRNITNIIKIDKSKIIDVNNSADNKIIHNNLKKINNIGLNRNINIIDINKEEKEEEEENEINYDFIVPEKYKINSGEIINTIETDGKKINIYADNKKEILFKSGVRKEIFVDGYQLVHFPNGDKKQKYIGKDEKVIYYYNETNTVQTSLKNGLNIFKFSNGQIEKHYPDGSKYIIYTNGIKRKITKNGEEKIFIPEEKKQKKVDEKNNIENKDNSNSKIDDNKINNKGDSLIGNDLLSFLDFEKDSDK